MEKEIIEINERDLEDYFKTLSGSSKIRDKLKFISLKMPEHLKEEFRSKFNNFIAIDEGKFCFIVEGGSKELNLYLAGFVFELS